MKLDKLENLRLSCDYDGNVEAVRPSNYAYSMLAEKGLHCLNLEDHNLLISYDVLMTDFEKVENFNKICLNENKNGFVTFGYIYVNTTVAMKFDKAELVKESEISNFFVHVDIDVNAVDDDFLLDTENKRLDSKKHANKFKIINIYYDPTDSETCNDVVQYLKDRCDLVTTYDSNISLILQTVSGFKFQNFSINPLSLSVDSMYNDSFKEVHEHIQKSLINQNKGIVLLYGESGTGKTNYIKHLTTLVNNKNFVFVPISMIGHLTDPTLISKLVEQKNLVLVIEDCENALEDRNNGKGNNDFVSTILNLTDGFLSDVIGIQIICTFNSDLDKIDKALLREGRLIAEYKFDKLSLNKTKELIKMLKFEFDTDKELSLSEIFNLQSKAKRHHKKDNKIGF
jgi:energy-coupling factor transporter ATP-binding protein EcfA2